MLRENLNDLVAFVTVAREGSFTKAAAQMGVSTSALSHAMRGLEERLGLRLLARSTRSVSPTEAGEKLLLTVAPRLEEIEEQLSAIGDLRGKPTGTIRINASRHAVSQFLWPRLKPLLQNYPEIHIEISAENRFTDIVAERFDMGVRLTESLPKDMIAVPLSGPLRMVAVASPAYLAEHPAPTHPSDLARHNCINIRLPTYGGFYAWEFGKGDEEMAVRVSGQLAFNDSQHALQACLDGYGIAFTSLDMVTPYLERGELVQILDDWCPPFDGYSLYYPNRRQHSTAFSLVLDALRLKD
ncbi:LysR family transcriptional regulator [Gallaecimonas pentaromativorans]|uniref:LysR family transcriptional regulator n=1 Tax=Gallaecimonas pentaromativorans TaxID=584787 RepID=A0A3N1PHV6_9GAMM|nr:LysR family transcriptional regulator [Gallaecimonas pentaromativorans]ROQ24146.1 LysR family transcriptional regulator [Gallaecimonas pentaromativorans]